MFALATAHGTQNLTPLKSSGPRHNPANEPTPRKQCPHGPQAKAQRTPCSPFKDLKSPVQKLCLSGTACGDTVVINMWYCYYCLVMHHTSLAVLLLSLERS